MTTGSSMDHATYTWELKWSDFRKRKPEGMFESSQGTRLHGSWAELSSITKQVHGKASVLGNLPGRVRLQYLAVSVGTGDALCGTGSCHQSACNRTKTGDKF